MVDENGVFNYFDGHPHDTQGVKWWISTTVSVLSYFMPCLSQQCSATVIQCAMYNESEELQDMMWLTPEANITHYILNGKMFIKA